MMKQQQCSLPQKKVSEKYGFPLFFCKGIVYNGYNVFY